MKKTLLTLAMGLGLTLGATAESTLNDRVEARLKPILGPGADVIEVVPLANDQLLEVMMVDGSVMHMTPDMNFLVYQNTLYKFDDTRLVNVSDARLNDRRAKEMAAIPNSDTVVFPAKGKEKAVVNVFTDIDCGYCQKLHREMAGINERGITVRYLAFPRAGVNGQQGELTESYRKINYVWCQEDRASAMTEVKALQSDLSRAYSRVRQSSDQKGAMAAFDKEREAMSSLLDGKSECSSPVVAQYNLGRAIGISGTPAMVTSDGELIPGYMKAADLAERLGIN